MERFKGTKGKWEVSPYFFSEIINENKETLVCINYSIIKEEELKANAQLIASAPELLEVLIELKFMVEKFDRVSVNEDIAIMKKVEQAINKALGGKNEI